MWINLLARARQARFCTARPDHTLGSTARFRSVPWAIPLHPKQRTLSQAYRLAGRCQQRTNAMQQDPPLIDDLVGAGEQRRRVNLPINAGRTPLQRPA